MNPQLKGTEKLEGTYVFDLERFGIHLVASPRHADVLLVTGPVTSFVSMAWHGTEAGSTCLAIPFAILLVPVGWVRAVCEGVEKDADFVSTGSYFTPGTRRVRWVFDPWWGFPKGPPIGQENYPTLPADKGEHHHEK